MDTASHALIGIAVAGLSGTPVLFDNTVYLAALIGAQAPDFDIITYIGGKFAYLRHHRSFSHSIPGIILWSTLICLGFSLFLPQDMLKNIFLWSFLGSLSHVISDCFNAHGTAFLWPLSKKRWSLNLLNVFDPCLLTLMLLIIFLKLPPVAMSLAIFAVFGCYLGFRNLLRRKAYQELSHSFHSPTEMIILPSLKSVFFWNFIVKTIDRVYVGQIGTLNLTVNIYTRLLKEDISDLTQAAQKTVIGQFFSLFTPFSYFKEFKEQNGANSQTKTVSILDLRYCCAQGFIYSASIVFGEDGLPCDSYIYDYKNKIRIEI